MGNPKAKATGPDSTAPARRGFGLGSARKSPAKELVADGDEILDTVSKRHNPGITRLIRTIADRE